MSEAVLPFRLDGKPLRSPRKAPPRAAERPEWSDYDVKTPVDCDHCVQVAYESALNGEPFAGLRKARRKRRHGGAALLLCSEHARIQQDQDRVDYPPGESTGKKARSGQRYIA